MLAPHLGVGGTAGCPRRSTLLVASGSVSASVSFSCSASRAAPRAKAASQKQIRPGTMSALLGIVGVKETPAKSRLGFYMGLRNGTA